MLPSRKKFQIIQAQNPNNVKFKNIVLMHIKGLQHEPILHKTLVSTLLHFNLENQGLPLSYFPKNWQMMPRILTHFWFQELFYGRELEWNSWCSFWQFHVPYTPDGEETIILNQQHHSSFWDRGIMFMVKRNRQMSTFEYLRGS